MTRTARARGKNHVAAFAAMALLALTLPGIARAQDEAPATADTAPAAPAPISFSQRGVPAEATAENGVIARERAFAAGRREAWNRIASAAGTTRSLSDSQIESMVTSIVIEEERTTPTRYAGRITVNFNPSRVRGIIGSAGQMAGDSGGGTSGSGSGAEPSRPLAAGPAVATIDAVALYGSLNQWLELRRRLSANAARVDIVAISTDRARLRLGLRVAPGAAVEEFARQGLVLTPGSGAPGDAWRVGLGGT